jgi:ABC-type polysaccharide/polyol phosphate export permease
MALRPFEQNLFKQFAGSLREPEFWAYASWLDIAVKHRRTSLGFIWFLVPTSMFLLVLGNVYSHLMQHSAADYLPYLGIGYVTWRFILQIINDSISTFTSHKAFIMDGRTRLTDFVLRSISKAAINLMFGLIVVAGVMIWSPHMHVYNMLTLLITLPLIALTMAWISVCVALVGARYREFHEITSAVLMVAFLVTPVLWTVDRFPPDTIRGLAVRLNPAFHLIDVVRAPVLGQMPETSSLIYTAALLAVGWPIAALLYRRYARFVPIWV